MSSTVFSLKRGDRLPSAQVPLTNADGSPVDLTTASSITFVMRSGPAVAPKVNAAASVSGAAALGVVRYDWAAGDTDTVGDYLALVVVTFPGSEPQSFPGDGYLLVRVEPALTDVPVYGAVAPTGYVSVAAFKASPEAAGANLANVAPGKDSAAQAAALAQLIARASDAIDGFLSRTLLPRTSQLVRTVRVNGDCEGLLVPIDRPYVRCTAATATPMPGGTAAAVAPSTVYADYDGDVPTLHVPLTSAGPGQRVQLALTVETGFACTTLAQAAAANAVQLTVANPAGVVAGQPLRIADPGLEEFPVVAGTYVPGSTTVPVSALAFAHAAGVAVSAVPGDLEEACILWTLGLLGARGGQEQEFPNAPVSPTAKKGGKRTAGTGFIARAQQLLRDGGYSRTMS